MPLQPLFKQGIKTNGMELLCGFMPRTWRFSGNPFAGKSTKTIVTPSGGWEVILGFLRLEFIMRNLPEAELDLVIVLQVLSFFKQFITN